MHYRNPVIPGFYPDPSVCAAQGKYYLVTSSFQYFPGVPLFESDDLVNWKQIGHVLTRPSQVALAGAKSSGGVFAATIRYHDGRFYMVTTNTATGENFYVYTDDIRGEWSDPIVIDQGGIDPSLLFDDGHVYFISNGADENGVGGVTQCEIDIATGRKLTPGRCIWQGAGGRFLEAPHVYRIGDWYYLFAAEGGTEYGHMEVCARAQTPWGPYTNCPANPILTNRNRAPATIQGIGHADLVQTPAGDWYAVTLGFRQIHIWQPYHHLGREVFLCPVHFGGDGWPVCGQDGTMAAAYEIPGEGVQQRICALTFAELNWQVDWAALRCPDWDNYDLRPDGATLRGTGQTLDDVAFPTFIALRQRAMGMTWTVAVQNRGGEGGLTVYSNEEEHYDLALRRRENGCEAVLKLNIGGIKHEQAIVPLRGDSAILRVEADAQAYRFRICADGQEVYLGAGRSKYLSNEVSSPFTGVMLGLYAQHGGETDFADLRITYHEEENE